MYPDFDNFVGLCPMDCAFTNCKWGHHPQVGVVLWHNARSSLARDVGFALAFLLLSIYSLLEIKRKLLTSRTCIQICIQCIHDAELVMTQNVTKSSQDHLS